MMSLLNPVVGLLALTICVPAAFAQKEDGDLTVPRELRVLKAPKQGGRINQIHFSPDGKTLATTGWNFGTVLLWECPTGKHIGTLQGNKELMQSVQFCDGGKTIISGGASGDLRFWDMQSQKQVFLLDSPKGAELYLECMALTKDEKTLAIGWINDNGIKLFNTSRAAKLSSTVLKGHTGPVTSLVFDKKGKALFSAGDDKTIRTWSLETKQETAVLRGHTDIIYVLALSPDEDYLASAAADSTVRIWDLKKLKTITQITLGDEPIPAIAYTPDGRTLISGYTDGTISGWVPKTGEHIWKITAHKGEVVNSIAVSPDGKFMASGGDRGIVKLWKMPGASGKK